jgi:hypothetical protein
MKRTLSVLIVACAASVAAAQGVPPWSEREASFRAITIWNAGCSGGQRDSWDDMAYAWYFQMGYPITPWGVNPNVWSYAGGKTNGTIVDSDFTDPGIVSWGRDDVGIRVDNVDAHMICTHGSLDNEGKRWVGLMRKDESGPGNCWSWQGHMDYDHDVEFVHISSCYGMSRATWWDGWTDSFTRVHQIDGFHGLMWIGQSRISEYDDFAEDSFFCPIAYSWLDNMYVPNIKDSDDQCPVVRGAGLSANGLWTRMSNEQYDYVYSDPVNPGHHGVYYISRCDPRGDAALPD